MLNLSRWRKEISKIKNPDRVAIRRTKITVHFPLFKYFYVKEYRSGSGFTLRQLVDRIFKIGVQAGKYAEKTKLTPSQDFVGEYALTSSNRGSDIRILGGRVYVSVQH